MEKLDKFFNVSADGSTIRTEVFSGMTAYFTMVYIIFLVPVIIMSSFPEAHNENGEFLNNAVLQNGIVAQQMLVVLTILACITAGIGTLILAFSSNLPFAQGPSIGISTFVAYTICLKMGYTYNEALAAVFISGIVFFFIVLLGLEKNIQDAIPTNIKYAVTAGIGLFIAFMGMQKAHLVESNGRFLVQLISFSEVTDNTKNAFLCLFGTLIIAVMLIKHIHGAILWGKIICIIIAIPMGLVTLNEFSISFEGFAGVEKVLYMDFQGLFSPDKTAFGVTGTVISIIVIIGSLCTMDVFETMGTIIATDNIITLSREGNINERFNKVLKADAISTAVGATLGMTSVSTYVESTAIVLEGGRTGLSGVVTAILFFLTIFVAPVAAAIPTGATATTLLISGILMMSVIKFINFEDLDYALPAFLTMAMMPMTFSIVTGIAMGLISHTVIMLFMGRRKNIKPGTFVLATLFTVQFLLIQ